MSTHEQPPPMHSRPQWARQLSPEERAEELACDERLIRRDVRAAFIWALLGCAFSLAVGLALMGLGLHTTNVQWGGTAFIGGLIVGYTGIVVSLARYYLYGEAHGWWH